MKNIQDWFQEYGESHQNRINKIIHWICIPLIFWSILALLTLIPNDLFNFINNAIDMDLVNWAVVAVFFGLLFYLRLSFNIFFGMLIFSLLVLIDIYYTVYLFDLHKYWGLFNKLEINGQKFLLKLSMIIFVFSWILQFIGHKIEGQKPSFFEDLQFLLIGPAWLLSFIYRNLGIKY